MRHLDEDAWEIGYDSYFEYVSRDDNPFDPETEEESYDLWIDGWDCADSDSDDE